MIELESRVLSFIRRHALIQPDETLVVAVSGGADSVCLLHLLVGWQRELGVKPHIAHLNHQLRGVDSEEDARYVANLAGQLGIPITIDRRDVAAYRVKRGCPIEEAARELRYDFLAGVASDVGANRVAIGHTRDDHVETILMHILRGTGTSGLRGLEPCSPIPYKSYQLSANSRQILLIRPLLDVTREETMGYCQSHQLEPRIDSSNLSLSFLRNRCRLELLPLLREYNPNVSQALLRLAEIAGDDSSFIERQAVGLWRDVARQEDDTVHLRKEKISGLPVALQRQLLRIAVAKVLGNTRDIEVNHIEAIRSLLNKPVGKRISLPHGITCWSEYNEIVIMLSQGSEHSRSSAGASPPQSLPLFLPCPFSALHGEFALRVPGEMLLPGWRVMASTVRERSVSPSLRGVGYRSSELSEAQPLSVIAGGAKQSQRSFVAEFDLHRAGTELFIRQRQTGDRFQPLGMNMLKKLQDFMVDAKIPFSWRERIPLVCSPRQIIWIVGWRIDDRVRVTEATREILRLEFVKSL